MKHEEYLAHLDALIEDTENRKKAISDYLQKLKGVRDSIASLSHSDLFGVEMEAHGVHAAPSTGQAGTKTQYEKIVDFLNARGNRPQTTTAIRVGTGISRSALSLILYRSHKDRFEKLEVPGKSRLTSWRLRQARENHPDDADKPPPHRNDLTDMPCMACVKAILRDNENKAMHYNTVAKEALRRGYDSGRTAGKEPDEIEALTAKSFWASMSRSDELESPKTGYYRLKVDSKSYHEGDRADMFSTVTSDRRLVLAT